MEVIWPEAITKHVRGGEEAYGLLKAAGVRVEMRHDGFMYRGLGSPGSPEERVPEEALHGDGEEGSRHVFWGNDGF